MGYSRAYSVWAGTSEAFSAGGIRSAVWRRENTEKITNWASAGLGRPISFMGPCQFSSRLARAAEMRSFLCACKRLNAHANFS